MTPSFLAPAWCDLKWSEFMPFRAWTGRTHPTGGGLYRIRVAGENRLAYVGQTGRNLRDRLSALRTGVLAAEMPFNDPHTAAPRLWAYRDADGLEFEASAAEVGMSKNDRMALECYLVWQYRMEAGQSTLCNFGRTHTRYTASRNRSTGDRGRRLNADEPDGGGWPSVPALSHNETEDRCRWMGLTWSALAPLTGASLKGVRTKPGVYTLATAAGDLIYIGQSTNLGLRLRSHSKFPWGLEVWWAACEFDSSYTSTQLLEIENDLIGDFYRRYSESPPQQFGLRGTSPVD